MNIIKDLFSSKILKYIVAPFFISLIFWGIVFYFFSDNIINLVMFYISFLPFGDSVNKIIANIGSFIILVFLYYQLVIISLGFFSSFFVEKIVKYINDKYYHFPEKKINIIEGVKFSLKGMVQFLLIFIFTFYLLFIPMVNIFYQLFLWSIANKKALLFDSASLFCDYKKIEKKYNINIWILVFITSIIYFIPIISLFGYAFQLIIVTHFILKRCKKEIE